MNTFFIFVGVVFLQQVFGHDEVGDERRCLRKNEEFNRCGSACPKTCDNYDIKNLVCTMQCVPGCFCKSPYIRNSEGDCVLPSECKAKEPQQPICKPKCRCTGANEVYNECGSRCARTCDTHTKMFKCAAVCQPGCFCATGYFRNKWNKCVLRRDCN